MNPIKTFRAGYQAKDSLVQRALRSSVEVSPNKAAFTHRLGGIVYDVLNYETSTRANPNIKTISPAVDITNQFLDNLYSTN